MKNIKSYSEHINEQVSTKNGLEKEFWDLVNSKNTQIESYQNLLNKYKKQGGPIVEYLTKICGSRKQFKKFKDIDEIDRISAKNLADIDIDSLPDPSWW